MNDVFRDTADFTDISDAGADDIPADSGCPSGLTNCDGNCVNTDSDHSNCGGCGHECEPAEVCSSGVCLFECPPGTVACSGSCVDINADMNNCGGCGVVCTAGLHASPVCEMGVCDTVCEEGWSDLDGDGSCETDCVPTSTTEICNGVDDNCDGVIDEGFECKMGREVGCITICGSTGTGICGLDCLLPPPELCMPPEEICNGEDDDCDGICDDGFECCRGESNSCTSSCGSAGSILCSATCSWSSCIPPDEICNGLDDDCDGFCDDGFECCQGETGNCNTSCGTTGTKTCSSSCTWSGCTPPPETCNGSDDNCDGTPDNTSGCRIPVYRFWCVDDHLYKNDSSTPPGCTPEGTGWFNYATAVSGTSFSTIELFRLYHGSVNDHFYTASPSERDSAISGGYVLEGNIGYCSPSDISGITTPLYRLQSPSSGDHFYTTSAAERDSAVSLYGYTYEGIACHVWTSS